MSYEQANYRVDDFIPLIRAEQIIELLVRKSVLQQKSVVDLGSAALPILTVNRDLADVFAQREGLSNSRINEKDVQHATNLLADLIVAVAADESYTARGISGNYESNRQLTAGEMWITQIKQRGFSINLIDSLTGSPEQDSMLALDLETWSIVNFQNGRVFSKSFTGSWSSLIDGNNTSIVPTASEAPRSVPELVVIYAKYAQSMNTRSGVRYVILHARTHSGEKEMVALITATEMPSRNILDTTIHKGRQARLLELANLTSYVPHQLKIGRLQDKELKIVREATERAKHISNYSNPRELAPLLEILMQIKQFKNMNVGAQAYVLSEWFNAIWVGTGDLGKNNPVGVGFNGRPIA